MTRSLWLLSFTDLAALLLAFFALVVSTRRFDAAAPAGPVPVAPVPVAGLPAEGGGAAPAGSFAYRAALARDGLLRLPPACRPARLLLGTTRLRAEWDVSSAGGPPEACADSVARVLSPLAAAPGLSVGLLLEGPGVDPADPPWPALRRAGAALAPHLPRPPLLLFGRGGRNVLALLVEEEAP